MNPLEEMVRSRRRASLGILVASLGLAALSTVHSSAAAWPWDPQNWTEAKDLVHRKFPKAPGITVPELRAWLDDSSRAKPLLIDARSRREFDDSQLLGAQHAETLSAALTLLEGRRKDTSLVVYCSVGYRSGAIVEGLIKNGFSQVKNLEGSLFEWANAGLPVYQAGRLVTKVHPYSTSWGRLLNRELWSVEP
jgi:rhodanese-related sulfurtransferase